MIVGRSVKRHEVPPLPDWTRFMDGRPWRLRRGRDFSVEVIVLDQEVRAAAAASGKAVKTARDKTNADALWVQFADAEISLGRACPLCGGTVLYRRHLSFVICGACRRQLIVSRDGSFVDDYDDTFDDDSDDLDAAETQLTEVDEPTNEVEQSPAAKVKAAKRSRIITLSSFTDIHLRLYDTEPDRKRYCGYGLNEQGQVVPLLVVVPLIAGAEIEDPDSPISTSHKVTPWPIDMLRPIFDAEGMRTIPDSEWDIVA